MSITVNVSSKDIQTLKAKLEAGKEAPASENALFNEFSNLLNEISLQLSSNAGADDIKVEAAKLKKVEKKEPEKKAQETASTEKVQETEALKVEKEKEVKTVKAKKAEEDTEENEEEIVEISEGVEVLEVSEELPEEEVVEAATIELVDSSTVETKTELPVEETSEETIEENYLPDEEVPEQVLVEKEEKQPILVKKEVTEVKTEEEKLQSSSEEVIEELPQEVKAKVEVEHKVLSASNEEKEVQAISTQLEEAPENEAEVVAPKNNIFLEAVQTKLSEKTVEDQVVSDDEVRSSYLDAAIHVDLFQGVNVLNNQIETVNTASVTSEMKVTATAKTDHNGSSFGFSEKGEEVQGENKAKTAERARRSSIMKAIGKVEAALKEIARSKDGSTIIMRLDPPELGAVKVNVTIRNGELSARFIADSVEVQQALKEKAGELQQSLRSLGIDVKEVKISVGSDSNRGFESMMQQHQGRRQQRGTVKEDNAVIANSKPEVTQADHWIA